MTEPNSSAAGGSFVRRRDALQPGAGCSRRRLLASGTGLAGALVLGAAGWRSAQGQAATPAAGMSPPLAGIRQTSWQPIDLVEPEVRRAAGGVLDSELRVQYAYHDIGGYRLYLRTYEGTIPGPTLRLQPGDTLRLALVNDLPPNRDPMPMNMNQPHHFNTTNLHTHGGHVDPGGVSDNIFREMEPGGRYGIAIEFPKTHARGTYWYHPHAHGSSDPQIASGMAGALILEGDFADVPEIAAAQERILILNEAVFDSYGTIETYDTVWPEAVPRFLSVNGQREPIVRLRPGEVQRWRIIHTGHEDNLRLTLDGHALHAIAYDGIPAARIDSADAMVIAPGQRIDVLVQAGSPGAYAFHAVANDQGYPSPTGPLARVVVAGAPVSMKLPTALPAPPHAPVKDAELTGSRRLTFSTLEPEAPAAASYPEFGFMVDDQLFDPDRVDQLVRLGAVEEWTVVNKDPSDHVFHIHTNPFQLTQVNGQALPEPLWRDTAIVPRDGSIAFRSRFLDFTGK
ncbi:MAG TPA: multicopper oxidase domain-containing protein, partial [Thermomicrobiales bacterium]|nr:multicopper oxidase domain-containing protein [Thermomicrobiales bacterium]